VSRGVVLVSDPRPVEARPTTEAGERIRYESFEAFFDAGYWPLVRSLTVICGDQEMAADCVQDAFVKAFTRWRRIERYDQPLAWVRHVALNKVRDHGRKQARTKRLLPRLVDDETYEMAEPQALDLQVALAELSPQQRTAAALFYVEQMSVAEIADTMKLSTGAVKYHLHAARDRLRSSLAPSVGNQP